MSVPANLLSILACPSCKGKLVWGENRESLICRGERLSYPVRDGIPALIRVEATELSPEELEKVDKA
ncbi:MULTISPECIES: Trm112 family protein [Gammaproteobacteria]|uniref:Trm112 family protein n=1 Tax=Gammaproteobacteria TaxID=1236 RepID=UPI000DD0BBE8|nr:MULTISPECIES: Trm112 family protein [Gammaproteobacteria]RTE86947.1 Trm112 family protein [Aliidiomarina sp. B3213]TCZ93263.1 Trm112 family protein [Lysobacter sp. N42]